MTLVLSLLVAWASSAELVKAELVQAEDFEPGEAIVTLEFTIHVGAGGEPLAEPVGLDLGLGFPFWLAPLGNEQVEGLPLGAVPQQQPERTVLQPGESATFTFRQDGDAGADAYQRTPQLMDEVRVSDIARLGIISRGSTDWELAGYQLVINGRTFAARDQVEQRARESVIGAELAWIEAREALQGFVEERDDLLALEEAGLATEQDLARLQEIREATRPLESTMAWQLGVSLGIRPWFVETGLRVPGREKAEEISSARVILATAAHTNAETSNHVYFQIGGRKYFLNPPGGRLTPDASPQGFELDLAAGPLAAGDLRGFALGMLAHDQPYATAPDRWHPERLLVELGGRLVYDSDSVPLDRRSLEIIRLVPPAHVDEGGQILVNEPNLRECVVWRAGHGQGLDLENGGPAELPGGMSAIEPEPAGDQESGLVDLGGDWWPGEAPLDPGSFAEWSGEEDYDRPGSDTLGALGPPWEGSASGSAGSRRWCFWGSGFEAGWFWQPGWMGAFTEGGGSGMPWYGIPEVVIIRFRPEDPNQAAWARLATRLEGLVAALLDALGRRPDVPLPIGEPPQIDNVHLVRDEANPRRFQVLWHVHGDRTQIERYEVSLWHIQPEMDDPLIADVTPPGQSTIPAVAGVADWASEWIELAEVNDRTAYIQPLVVAVLNDGSDMTNWPIEVGAALPWLAPEADENNQPQPDRYTVFSVDPTTGGATGFGEPIRDVEPEEGRAGAWAARVLSTHRDVSLDSTPGITSNVAVRAAPNQVADTTVDYVVRQPLDPARRYELFGHAGYLDSSARDSAAHVEAHYSVSPPGGAVGGAGPAQQELLAEFEVSRSEPPRLFTGTIDLSAFPQGSGPLRITIRIPRGNDDPAAPIAFYGLRLLPI